ncbi:MAG: putative N-acetylmannosamine-6-phosphate 2-epimerase [Fimbriimonadales bacterium]|nr:putative N-acetylmannosamine-6-phosphate 2-epimerase [Fimbriimonadales bacterium]
MDGSSLRRLLREAPVVALIHCAKGSVLDDPSTVERLARACAEGGARLLRVEGADNVRRVKVATGLPVIGRIDRVYPDSSVRSTATVAEVRELLEAGCELIALDATSRPRPHGERLGDLVTAVRSQGRLAVADCEDEESAAYAIHAGCDAVSTGLAGYGGRPKAAASGPDWELLRKVVRLSDRPVLAEGRFAEEWQVEAALRIGASGVVIGSALADPAAQTRRFLRAGVRRHCRVAAFDIGVHWLRFGLFDEDWRLLETDQTPLVGTPEDWIGWFRSVLSKRDAECAAVVSPGTVNPRSGNVWETPEGWTARFSAETLGAPTVALNRALAAAWAHACLPEFAGMRVATLLVGKSVACGLCNQQSLVLGSLGQHPRLDEMPTTCGKSFEALLEGVSTSPRPTEEQRARANAAIAEAVRLIGGLWLPEVVVLSGPVGSAEWVELELGYRKGWAQFRVLPSPLGGQAALHGAAALALFPPKALRGG